MGQRQQQQRSLERKQFRRASVTHPAVAVQQTSPCQGDQLVQPAQQFQFQSQAAPGATVSQSQMQPSEHAFQQAQQQQSSCEGDQFAVPAQLVAPVQQTGQSSWQGSQVTFPERYHQSQAPLVEPPVQQPAPAPWQVVGYMPVYMPVYSLPQNASFDHI